MREAHGMPAGPRTRQRVRRGPCRRRGADCRVRASRGAGREETAVVLPPMEALKVYWRPGCSSCVRVKEFLSGLGVDYESVNVSARPEAMQELAALGVRTVPVVSRGSEFVFAQELADVSVFIGRKVDFQRLPAPVLMDKWLKVL